MCLLTGFCNLNITTWVVYSLHTLQFLLEHTRFFLLSFLLFSLFSYLLFFSSFIPFPFIFPFCSLFPSFSFQSFLHFADWCRSLWTGTVNGGVTPHNPLSSDGCLQMLSNESSPKPTKRFDLYAIHSFYLSTVNCNSGFKPVSVLNYSW